MAEDRLLTLAMIDALLKALRNEPMADERERATLGEAKKRLRQARLDLAAQNGRRLVYLRARKQA